MKRKEIPHNSVPLKSSIPRKTELPARKKTERLSKWEYLENFLIKHERACALLLVLLFAFFGVVLFDVRISVGGDDASYIERGYQLVHYGEMSFYQSPLYHAILGIVIAFFGINLIVLKSLSLLFLLGQQIFLYFTFRKRIPLLILFTGMFLIATNLFIQYYSSQTYTEAAFMFFQALSLYIIFELIDQESLETKWFENKKMWMTYGLLMLLLSLCKSIAIICFLPLIIYFLIQKRWRSAAKAFVSFLIWKIIYEILLAALYRNPSNGQFRQVLLKDLYHPELGHETITGTIERFFQNVNTSLSRNLIDLLSIADVNETNVFVTLLITFVLIASFIYLFHRNKYLFFLALYTYILLIGICFGIQANLAQPRLLIILIPLFYFFILGAAYYFSLNNFRSGIVIISLVFLVTFLQLKNTMKIGIQHLPVLKKNLQGDMYFGYSPDWINYLKLSSWCGENLSPSAYVACRKASMSFIYGNGRRFYEINHAPESPDPDSILTALRKEGVTHFLVAKLRVNPLVNDGVIINTIHKIAVPIFKKYPEKLKLIKAEGKEEEAALFEIIY